MSAVRAVIVVVAALVLGGCARGPAATPFQPVIPAFQADTCDELAAEFATTADASMRAVIDGPDMIADEQKSVLIKRMQTLLAVAVTEQARKSGVVGTCAMPGWLQQAERGFSNRITSVDREGCIRRQSGDRLPGVVARAQQRPPSRRYGPGVDSRRASPWARDACWPDKGVFRLA